jgi:hypothetical protein
MLQGSVSTACTVDSLQGFRALKKQVPCLWLVSHAPRVFKSDVALQVEWSGQLALPRSVFVANDWPTGLLPLRLLAWQQKQPGKQRISANQVLTSASPALVPTGTGREDIAVRSKPRSQAAIPAKLEVFHRLYQLPDASPDDTVWQDAMCILQDMLTDSLRAAKVCPA